MSKRLGPPLNSNAQNLPLGALIRDSNFFSRLEATKFEVIGIKNPDDGWEVRAFPVGEPESEISLFTTRKKESVDVFQAIKKLGDSLKRNRLIHAIESGQAIALRVYIHDNNNASSVDFMFRATNASGTLFEQTYKRGFPAHDKPKPIEADFVIGTTYRAERVIRAPNP